MQKRPKENYIFLLEGDFRLQLEKKKTYRWHFYIDPEVDTRVVYKNLDGGKKIGQRDYSVLKERNRIEDLRLHL